MSTVTESLAGRTANYELMTLSLAEYTDAKHNIVDILVNGNIDIFNTYYDNTTLFALPGVGI